MPSSVKFCQKFSNCQHISNVVFVQEKTEEEEALEEKFDSFDINHTAPQHRQYLGNFLIKYIQSIDRLVGKCVSYSSWLKYFQFYYYLDYGGFGFGSPSQRQKQHQKYRAVKANEAVFQHRYRVPALGSTSKLSRRISNVEVWHWKKKCLPFGRKKLEKRIAYTKSSTSVICYNLLSNRFTSTKGGWAGFSICKINKGSLRALYSF